MSEYILRLEKIIKRIFRLAGREYWIVFKSLPDTINNVSMFVKVNSFKITLIYYILFHFISFSYYCFSLSPIDFPAAYIIKALLLMKSSTHISSMVVKCSLNLLQQGSPNLCWWSQIPTLILKLTQLHFFSLLPH